VSPINNAFVVRPFGEKSNVDFNAIHDQLIAPALQAFGVAKTTTLDILESGNIRADMFRLLLTADVVIADLSIHNANVFYELGIRHSLVKKHTILIRADVDKIPFDLFTDRYLLYDVKDPAACLATLIQTIEATLRTSNETDSPVFSLLPGLVAQDAESFIVVPPRFSEAVREVVGSKTDDDSKTADLVLFATEIAGLAWEVAGLRHLGRTLLQIKAFEAAKEIWERIRSGDPDDVEANHCLSTIYQRLGDPARAEIALDRVLRHPLASKTARSEALALRARNAKSDWTDAWRDLPTMEERREAALTSTLICTAAVSYRDAYLLDLKNFYPGLNALACALLLVQLANSQPDLWAALHDNPERELEPFTEMLSLLPGSVRISIEAALPDATGDNLQWADVSLADLAFYCSMKPAVVAARYKQKTATLTPFKIGAVRDQLEIFRGLQIFTEAAEAGLAAMKQAAAESRDAPPHVILFTGHRVDEPERTTPRFPESKVAAATAEIENAIDSVLKQHPNVIGVAGAASGGDMLFHEVLRRRGIPTEIYLALPPDLYARRSVEPSKGDWRDRFDQLVKDPKLRILQEQEKLPDWLFEKGASYKVWERANLWMLGRALVHGASNMTLIALWNGESGDGPGGTADMVSRAEERGAKVVLLGKTVF
jgi:tetratricopeptide (TPR) repeat protein